jgi:hypothetical protein
MAKKEVSREQSSNRRSSTKPKDIQPEKRDGDSSDRNW